MSAEKAGLKDPDLPLLKIIIGERDLNSTTDADDEVREILEDRLGKLRAFTKLAGIAAADYERQLKGIKPASSKTKAGKAAAEPRLAKPPAVIFENHTVRKPKAIKKKKKH